MSAKQCQCPCSGPPTDSVDYWKCTSRFPFNLIGKLTCQMQFLTGHGAYSNPGTQVSA